MSPIDTIKAKLSDKETEDLLAIWTENNRVEWRDEAFDAIQQILTERGVALPEQLSDKETEDLLAIWTENNRDEWRDEAFDAIQQILTERGVALLEQKPLVTHKKLDKTVTGIGIGSIIAYLVGKQLAEQFPDSPIMNVLSTAVIGCLVGTLAGMIPYFVGKARGHAKLSKVSLVACAASGALFGVLLAGPLALLFTIITLARKKTPKHETAEPTDGHVFSESATSASSEKPSS